MTPAPDRRPPADEHPQHPQHPDHPEQPGLSDLPEQPEQPRLPLDGVDPDWRIDEHTRAVGLAGVAAARAILDRGRRAA